MYVLTLFYLLDIFESISFSFPFHNTLGKTLFRYSIIYEEISWDLLL